MGLVVFGLIDLLAGLVFALLIAVVVRRRFWLCASAVVPAALMGYIQSGIAAGFMREAEFSRGDVVTALGFMTMLNFPLCLLGAYLMARLLKSEPIQQ